MNGDRLNAAVDRYLQAAALNAAPPPVASDALVDGGTPIEQLLRVLGLAANTGDPEDAAASAEGHGQREAWTAEAAGTFAGQDDGAAQQLGDVAGAGGMIAGLVGGLLAPLTQIPQQFSQGAQQAVQAATSLLGQHDSLDEYPIEDPATGAADDTVWDTAEFDDVTGSGDAGWPSAGSGGGATQGGGGTVPAAVLGPAPIPSPATHPSAAPALPSPQVGAGTPAPSVSPGMAGMPMVPPTGLAGAAAADPKADTKRLAVPAVPHGAPVQGRITPASGAGVTTRIEGKPVAARRVRADEAPTDGAESR